MTDPTVLSTLTDAFDGLGVQLLTVAAVGLTIGITLFALRKGYSIVRGFIH
jgi:hypothetical protein